MDFYLTTLGCRLNEAELGRWRRELEASGHRVVAQSQAADVVVINTCAVTGEAAKKSRQLVRRLRRENERALIVATGCHAELAPHELSELGLVLGNRDKDSLLTHVFARLAAAPALAPAPTDAAPGLDAPRPTRAFVKIQDGCRNRCAFCIVTIARGEERSRDPASVVAEVRALCEAGVQEVVLTGVHLGGYGSDLGESLEGLVARVLEQTPVARLRLGSLEPWDLGPRFFEVWRDPRLCPHLHLPLQSGSDGVLRRMSRRCTTAAYAALVERARAAIPDLVLTTDLIVGYPGESEDELEETLAFVEAMRFADVHLFTFSAREGTRAARLPGRIAPEVQRTRRERLQALVRRLRREALVGSIGTTRPVLFERDREVLPSGVARVGGYTDHYLRVVVEVDAGLELTGRIVPTRLVGVSADGVRLEGQLR